MWALVVFLGGVLAGGFRPTETHAQTVTDCLVPITRQVDGQSKHTYLSPGLIGDQSLLN
jgi:hypothetical protein